MGARQGGNRRPEAVDLPAWPLQVGMIGLPVFWAVGLIDVMWPLLGLVMLGLLGRARHVALPKGMGIWLLFLLLVVLSGFYVSEPAKLLIWGYRLSHYAAAGVVAVYVYNARRHLTRSVIVGSLVWVWAFTVVGGFLGMLFPEVVFRTALSYVVPGGLLGNDLVHDMVVRPFAQYFPDAWNELSPRPSAPYHYTNNWGQMYTILTPFVIVALQQWRRRPRIFWPLAIALPVSLVPAFLTLNRGMFIGLGLAATYIAIRQVARGNPRALLGIAALIVVAASIFTLLPIEELLAQRLEGSSTTEDRASLYQQSLDAIRESPVFGFGVPQEADRPGLPPVGTQGHVWMVLVSHGPIALLCFVGWMFMAWLRSLRRHDLVPMVANACLLVTLVQSFFYGLFYGLPVVAVFVALVLRRELTPEERAPVAVRRAETAGRTG